MKRGISDRGIATIEILVIVALLAFLVGATYMAIEQRRMSEARAGIERNLEQAALAVENYAAENEGDYTGTDGMTTSGLRKLGLRPVGDALLTVTQATEDTYCIRSEDEGLGSDRWAVATYSSEERKLSSNNSCG